MFRPPTSKVSVLSDGVAKGRQTMQGLPLPLVKPDVRNYRIRLTDDHSAIGIRKELTALILQVNKPCGPQCLIQRRPSSCLHRRWLRVLKKATQPDLHIPVHLAAGHAGMAKARNRGSCLALWPSFHRNRGTFRGKPVSGLNPSSVVESFLKRFSLF